MDSPEQARPHQHGHDDDASTGTRWRHQHEDKTVPALGRDDDTHTRSRNHGAPATLCHVVRTPALTAAIWILCCTMTTMASNIEYPWDDHLDHSNQDDSRAQAKYYNEDDDLSPATRAMTKGDEDDKHCNEDEDPSTATRTRA
ncbi:hypothetical protein BDZ89DRAFT_1038303 [Hymenopellis radicata]|nr:hypothetical protein BDZ89DRAFT_1038303 [Hymenopellis radicata]